mmetsp:Transcript_7832/g.21505  ORF Transcript_7832/g.21505 Transcript_7832/m.21505 type:complete len:88 (-) Transcript_7832:112-375(-)
MRFRVFFSVSVSECSDWNPRWRLANENYFADGCHRCASVCFSTTRTGHLVTQNLAFCRRLRKQSHNNRCEDLDVLLSVMSRDQVSGI